MSRDSSPLPSSDDSAVGSASSCVANSENNSTSSRLSNPNHGNNSENNNITSNIINNNHHAYQPTSRPKITRPSAKDLEVSSDDLEQAAKQMRNNNVSLISRSIRTVLHCFDDLDVRRFDVRTDYLINFISNGINRSSSSILRPVSILWPDNYDLMVEQLSVLDAFLLNTEFREKPVEWMIRRSLTSNPSCKQCNDKMSLKYENNTVRWQCQKAQACLNYSMPITRPSFFNGYENVSLDKILFAVYYWSTCTPGDDLYGRMNIERNVLDGIWKRIQNVCRNALEKSYPRHRLTNIVDQNDGFQSEPLPIDLVSIKLNEVFVICAKHPKSNLVRLGLHIPNVSMYSFADLTDSWFASGAHIRVSESKFLDLNKRRTDLKIQIVPRLEMTSKDGQFCRESAFGYLICQLSHVLKDFDSSSLSRETLKLVLAEMQWREQYGTTPLDAFVNMVNHMSTYGESSGFYTEPASTTDEPNLEEQNDSSNSNQHVWAEKYFYATIDPIDSDGKIICRYSEPPVMEVPPQPDVRIHCHACNLRYECFDFGRHMISHVENDRKEFEKKKNPSRMTIECKHCFKSYKREEISMHNTLHNAHFHNVQFGCRMCCIRLPDRAQYLEHMRRLHFEHETPYHCPSCTFASSFQREVFIHFQEEHRHSMIVMCLLCLRSFTVAKPELMTKQKMTELSQLVYNHIAEHFACSKEFACSNCCLCFVDRDKLINHQKLHHNPLNTLLPKNVQLREFVVTKEEEKYCIRALPLELFEANKRPNCSLLLPHSNPKVDLVVGNSKKKPLRYRIDEDSLNSQSIASSRGDSDDGSSASSDDDSFYTVSDGSTIHVRGLSESAFLAGGEASLQVSSRSVRAESSRELSSQKLIDLLSKMKRADGVLPNQSVLLTPKGTPAICVECLEFVTVDHFVESILCKSCKYLTHCPRAATKHNTTRHKNV